MPVELKISPRIVRSISTLYNDVLRIFMEYIDNSLDSAEEFYDKKNKSYTKTITVQIEITGNSYKNGKVFIKDNCYGVTDFNKLVQSIGYSDKELDNKTSGMFGYGIYSFMAACEKLEVTTKLLEQKEAKYIIIDKKKFSKKSQEDVLFEPKEKKGFVEKSGTIICLSSFEKDSWRQIKLKDLKNEIEKHFELILSRKNLKVELIWNKERRRCKPFDYENYDGELYEDYLQEIKYEINKKNERTCISKIQLEDPIHIFIKIVKGKILNKEPILTIKGRRVSEVKNIRAFKSKHKMDLWDHPNVTGFIELPNIFQPTIARNDFKRSPNVRALFYTLFQLEELLLDIKKM